MPASWIRFNGAGDCAECGEGVAQGDGLFATDASAPRYCAACIARWEPCRACGAPFFPYPVDFPQYAGETAEYCRACVAADTGDPPARYVVVENKPGYLPDDDDPATFATLRDARAHARYLVAQLRECHAEGEDRCMVRTDSRTAPRSWYVVTDRPHDLGRVVEILDAEGVA